MFCHVLGAWDEWIYCTITTSLWICNICDINVEIKLLYKYHNFQKMILSGHVTGILFLFWYITNLFVYHGFHPQLMQWIVYFMYLQFICFIQKNENINLNFLPFFNISHQDYHFFRGGRGLKVDGVVTWEGVKIQEKLVTSFMQGPKAHSACVHSKAQ